jgi:hypothetical protein
VSLAEFCRSAGIYHQLATRLLEPRILEPDGMLGAKPTFRADLGSVEAAKAAIASFRAQQNRVHQNLRELSHV